MGTYSVQKYSQRSNFSLYSVCFKPIPPVGTNSTNSTNSIFGEVVKHNWTLPARCQFCGFQFELIKSLMQRPQPASSFHSYILEIS